VCDVTNVCVSSVCNTPYGGTARAITSVIQAEDFDVGSIGTPPGEGCSYHDLTTTNDGGSYRTAEGVDIDATTDTGGGYRVVYIRTGEWLKYTVNVPSTGTYDFTFRVASNGGVAGAFHLEDENAVNLTGVLAVPDTGAVDTFEPSYKTGVALTVGTHVLKLVVDYGPATNAQWRFNWFTAVKQVACATAPYGGTARALPGTVQAEDFDVGNTGLPPGEGCAYHDTTLDNQGNQYRTAEGVDVQAVGNGEPAGYNIGWTTTGEWLKYTVSVATAGNFDLSFRVRSVNGTANAFHLEDENGKNITGSVGVPANGTGTYDTVTVTGVPLSAGTHALKLVVDYGVTGNGGWIINYFSAVAACNSPYGGTAWPVPGTVQAEDYDVGTGGVSPDIGEGCSYHDINGPGNVLGAYRTTEGVDIQAATDTGGGYNVGWNDPGEWKKYTVNVATTGTYLISFRVASVGGAINAIHLEDEGGNNLTGAITVPNTTGWQTWQTVSKAWVALTAGRHIFRVVNDVNNWNHNWFSAAASVQKEAEAGVNTGGLAEGGGDSGGKILLNSAGDNVCWTGVNMAGVANARLHYGNAEPAGDTVQLTYPNTGTVIGTFALASTGGWSSPNLADATIAFAAQAGTGQVCVIGQGTGWIASVDYLLLQ
jgi:hypothetical protein